MSKIILCPVSEMEDKDAREFSLKLNGIEQSIFVVKQAQNFFAYRNACPHTGGPLNWQGDIFLNVWKDKIQCSLHGALFEIHSGKCVYGPCKNERLQALVISVENEQLAVIV